MAPGDAPTPPKSEHVTQTPAAPAAASTAVQPAPDAPPIPLPPAPPPPDPSGVVRRLRVLDGALVAIVLAFAFLAASFKVGNSDFWLHLAAGRLLAQGGYTFGHDPFTFGSGGAYWVNHAWLYDLLTYALYQLPHGGIILVVVKALLVTALAGVMLAVARVPGRRLWVPAACVGLAVLAMSPRLQLQPAVVSYLLLGVTLWLLTSARPDGATRLWLIPPLCLLWVNLDAWFLLGPVTVGLYLLGLALQRWFPQEGQGEGPAPDQLRTLGWVLGASVVACLVNPHHVRAFALPTALGLDAAAGVLGKEAQFRGQFLFPWEGVYFQRGVGLTVAGMAYFPLVGLGLLSFGLTFGAWRWWRLVLWAAFCVLSSVNAVTIPFFAVVAGPITALNFLDFAAFTFGAAPVLPRQWHSLAVFGRALTLLAGVALLAATVPGWTQVLRPRPRPVGWGVEVDPSLRQAALQIQQWRDEGRVEPGAERWFNTAPEVVYYLAWFCPGERGFLDGRLPLFGGAAEDYSAVRGALLDPEAKASVWRDVLGKREARYLVFHARDLGREEVALLKLYGDSREWAPLYLGGRTAIFGWLGHAKPPPGSPVPALTVDFDARAFGPGAEKAPAERPRPPRVVPWWQRFYEPELPPSPEADTASQHLVRFNARRVPSLLENQGEWHAYLAAHLVGTAGLGYGPLPNGALLPARLLHTFARPQRPAAGAARKAEPDEAIDRISKVLFSAHMGSRDQGPPASLYLGVRAARRALADNPDDPLAYMRLAQHYQLLGRETRELRRTCNVDPRDGAIVPFFLPATLIRQSQVAGALNNALLLEPAPEVARVAHQMLADLYSHPWYFELRVRHGKELLRLSRELPRPGESEKQDEERLAALDKHVKELDKQLKGQHDKYVVRALNKPVLQKAAIALELGLAGKAVEELMKADVSELSDKSNPNVRPGGALLIHLLLGMGRLEEARDGLSPSADGGKKFEKAILGGHPELPLPAYDWFQVQLAAASGDYAAADKHLGELIDQTKPGPLAAALLAQFDVLPGDKAQRLLAKVSEVPGSRTAPGLSAMTALSVGHLLLQEAPSAAGMPRPLHLLLPMQYLNPKSPRRAAVPVDAKTTQLLSPWQTQLRFTVEAAQRLLKQEADLRAVRAWLALEAGEVAAARAEAEKALDLSTVGWRDGAARLTVPRGGQPLALLVTELVPEGRRAERD